MPQPFDYTMPSPMGAIKAGISTAVDLANIKTTQQIKQLALQKAQADMARQKMLSSKLSALSNNPNAKWQDYMEVVNFLPEKQSAAVRGNWETLGKERQATEMRFGGQVLSAFNSENPEIGKKMLLDRANAERSAGNEEQAKTFETYAKIAEVSPEQAKKMVGIMVASLPGSEKTLQSALLAQKMPSQVEESENAAEERKLKVGNLPARQALENSQTGAEIQNLESQISERAKRLNLDRDKFQSDVEMKLYALGQKRTGLEALPPDARKLINDSTIKSVEAEQASGRMLTLADKIEELKGGWGAFTTLNEAAARAFGNEDELSLVRKEYIRMRMGQAMKLIPPGPATDKDIALALEGFPKPNAGYDVLSSFLRGMSKINQLEAATESAKSDWVDSVGSLGRARRDFEISGVKIPTGATFTDFARQFVQAKMPKAGQETERNPSKTAEISRKQSAETIRKRRYYEEYMKQRGGGE